MSEGAPALGATGEAVTDAAAAAADAIARADAAAAAADAATSAVLGAEAEFENDMPGNVDELQRALRHERARTRVLRAEVAAVREETEHTLERQRRGADRSLREMQSEFARLHRENAEMRESVMAADGRANGEAGFRRRAEQGWLSAQNGLEATQAELQQSKVQCGELEGRLSAADAVVTELRESRKKVGN